MWEVDYTILYGTFQWNLSFIRSVQDWEVKLVVMFFEWCTLWNWDKVVKIVFDGSLPREISLKLGCTIKHYLTRKIIFCRRVIDKSMCLLNVFVWMVDLGKVLTLYNLREKFLWWIDVLSAIGVGNPSSPSPLWSDNTTILSLVRVEWVMPRRLELLDC